MTGEPPKPLLYIEDNYHNRRLVRKILASRGYQVIEAESGREGLDLVRSLRPPLVLLDIGLPDLDGLEVIRSIRAEEGLRHTPVIAITASAMRGDRERFLEAGCDDYLSKPIQALELIERVASYYPSEAASAAAESPDPAPA